MMGWGLLAGVIVVALVIVAVIEVLRLLPTCLNIPRFLFRQLREPCRLRVRFSMRYAKGDLTTEEYLERVKHLGSA